MSASEVIEMIKKLPPDDRRQVEEFFRDHQAAPETEFIPRADLEKSAKEIFARHDTLFRKLAQ